MKRTLHLTNDDEQLVEVDGHLFLIDILYNKNDKPILRVERQ